MSAARNIHAEFAQHAANQAQREALVKMGVTGPAIAKAGGFGVAGVAFMKDRFEFDGPAEAMVLPVYEGAHLIDLVAVDSKRPIRFARLYGRAWCLGNDFNAWEPNAALPVWRTPLRWLQAGAEGIVIMDWAAAYWQLPDADLVAEDEHHGQQIRRLMMPDPWRGQVLVRRAAA
jgi:hypothetical protein